jgi:hypothetical protein
VASTPGGPTLEAPCRTCGARPVPACTCRRLLCGGALWGAPAKHASRHGRGRAFGLYLMQASYRGAWVQGQYRPVRAGLSVLCGGALWGARAKHASRHGRGRAFGLYLNRDAGILSGGVGARLVPACTCRRLLCGGALWGALAEHASRHGRGRAFGLYLNRDAGILSGGVGAR